MKTYRVILESDSRMGQRETTVEAVDRKDAWRKAREIRTDWNVIEVIEVEEI